MTKGPFRPFLRSVHRPIRSLTLFAYHWLRLKFYIAIFGIDRGLDAISPHVVQPIIFIPTRLIKCHLPIEIYRNSLEGRFVSDGDWDIQWGLPIKASPPAQQMVVEDLFIRSIPVRETDRYRELASIIEVGHSARTCRTLEELEEKYFNTVIQTYESIRTEGYMTQRQLGRRGRGRRHEIAVLINRDGEPIIFGGKHRLAMCHILGVDTVPVVVMGVHRLWARRCCDLYGVDPYRAVIRGLQGLSADSQRSPMNTHRWS